MTSNKVQVRFPDGHVVWQYPKGQQATKVREAFDDYLKISIVLDEIRLLVVDNNKRLKTLEDALSVISGGNRVDVEHSAAIRTPIFDVEAFKKL